MFPETKSRETLRFEGTVSVSRETVSYAWPCDHELANERARCSGKTPAI